jgi:integrase
MLDLPNSQLQKFRIPVGKDGSKHKKANQPFPRNRIIQIKEAVKKLCKSRGLLSHSWVIRFIMYTGCRPNEARLMFN